MAYSLKEGDKRNVRAQAERLAGTGPITLTSPERRILDGNRALVIGFDWAAATWDAALQVLSALFDSTLAGLTVPATYYMQLRGTIGQERYVTEVTVSLQDIGP